MTASALHSGRHFLKRELPSERAFRRVTPKAAQLIVAAHQSPSSFVNVSGDRTRRAQRGTKTIQLPKPADAALVEFPVFLQNVSLPNRGTRSHRPPNGHSDRRCSVRNRIVSLVSFSLNSIGVLADSQRQHRMIDQNLALLNRFERMSHGSAWLCPRLG